MSVFVGATHVSPDGKGVQLNALTHILAVLLGRSRRNKFRDLPLHCLIGADDLARLHHFERHAGNILKLSDIVVVPALIG